MKYDITFPYVLTDEYGENPKEVVIRAVGSYTAGCGCCPHPNNEREFLNPGEPAEFELLSVSVDGVRKDTKHFEDIVLEKLRG